MKTRIDRILLIASFCFFGLVAYAQPEICDNCIDDDGDGLIDCYDDECLANVACQQFITREISDTACATTVVPTFGIQVLWEATFSGVYKEMTPVAGDIDADGVPEVLAWGSVGADRILKVFDGSNGNVELTITINDVDDIKRNGVAIADIDNDGFGEIILLMSRKVRCYEHDGTLKWNKNLGTLGANTGRSIGIADFNGDGSAEIYFFAQDAWIIDALTGATIVRFTPNYGRGMIPAVADVLPDAFCGNCTGLEFVTGPEVFAINIGLGTATVAASAPAQYIGIATSDFASVADMNLDNNLDIVVNGHDTLYAWDPLTGLPHGFHFVVRASFPTGGFPPYAGNGGVPTIGNFDVDPFPEIATESTDEFVVLDNSLAPKWTSPISDNSSTVSSAIAFDFNCDGIQEIVFRDEGLLRIFNPLNGAVLGQINSGNLTSREHPLLADINGDGHANISMPTTNKLVVWESDNVPWPPTRQVMNQFAYTSTNINDDLTIPCTQQNNAHPGLTNMNGYLFQPNLRDQNDKCYTVVPIENISISSYIDTALCQGDTMLLAPTDWWQYTYSWTPPAGLNRTDTSIVEAFPLDTSTYMLVVNKANCGFDTLTVNVNVEPTATAVFDTLSCGGNSVNLVVNGGQTYLWSPSIGLSDTFSSAVFANPSITTNYSVVVNYLACLADTFNTSVDVFTGPMVGTEKDTTIDFGESVQINASGGITYSWTNATFLDDANIASPTASPLVTTAFVVTITDSNGCSANDTITVFILNNKQVFIPNAFSPNNDGYNDNFRVIGGPFLEYYLKIYDRWGKLVFESNDQATHWNGTYKKGALAGEAVYVYRLIVQFTDGDQGEFSGNVTLSK